MVDTLTYHFNGKQTDFYLDKRFEQLAELTDMSNCFIITDENVARMHGHRWAGHASIVIKAGEAHKTIDTVHHIIETLLKSGADRQSRLIGIGGGVVTDITGFVAATYMRGISFAFIPTTLLGMVDAAIGGKNGVDVGLYKNIMGTIRQPDLLLYDYSFLQTLPTAEWQNGFAEVIKHACIRNQDMFATLETHTPEDFQQDEVLLHQLVKENVQIKCGIVEQDVEEKGDRRLLNFGHTFGHAIENLYGLPHGHAVSIGMNMAGAISEEMNNFTSVSLARLRDLITLYGLPLTIAYDVEKVFAILKADKKKESESIHYILLKEIGEAEVKRMSLMELEPFIKQTQ
jgi:3-dehydroquinate synthase